MTDNLPTLHTWSSYRRVVKQHLLEQAPSLRASGLDWFLQVGTADEFTADRQPPTEPELAVVLLPGAALVVPHDPRRPGCPACLLTRRQLANPKHLEVQAAETQWTAADPPLTRSAEPADLAEAVLAAARGLITRDDLFPARPVVQVSSQSLAPTTHRYLPDPLCQTCGGLPDDRAEDAHLVLSYRPKHGPRSYRYENPVQRLDELKDLYVDEFCGVLHSLRRDTQGGLAVAGALMKLRRHEWVEPGFGRSRSYDESEATAILEALERYGGVQPGGRRTVVEAPFAELGEDAVDPRLFGAHPASTYEDTGNHYRDFDAHTSYRWVWAHSFLHDRPRLVLESQAYYYVAHDTGTAPYLYEVSNGCALGATTEEAALHGLLEVAERDAFLLAWYRRLSLPRLRPATARYQPVEAQLRMIERETGYRVQLHDQTMENGIPSVWALARNPDPSATGRPALVCAAGAHPSLEKAALNALSELGPFLNDFIARFPSLAERAERMVDDFSLVQTMEDHSTLFGSPRMRHYLDFLDEGPEVSFATAERNPNQFTAASMAEDLLEMVGRFTAEGQEVLVVDQTTDEHRAGGLSCVKVLVTGSLTMTFGHHLRRIDGIPRLDTVPARLGLRPGADPSEPVLPHPFP
ncbi:TOMM precursor leader peptide-binding protein [Nesterenkonia alkaliphila]|uniref:TOMM leader peptide-binding protein n=1 Tax=Nesterenkonia alkaliphila TaxID=1463631 RepID=A0A7K1UFF3_9MICC|nr:TOMM precursor leader peptide-binding protein [Nesterenkonia alkaliphila]MVT25114.1 TOMM precursor leader peptide-binding protein [Nesterenkonia alkaliphila]GFZ82833.1 SagD family biosynthesis docking scaffold protein [Nesterenkonia alkaliphila]